MADSSAFFSLEKGNGWRYRTITEDYAFDDKTYCAGLHVLMKEGEWLLNIEDSIIDESTIKRRAEIRTIRDSLFMDYVMRFRFKSDLFEYAEIAGKRYYHSNTNIYYQFETDRVLLKGRNFDINIRVQEVCTGNKMNACCYVRDFPGEWIVHLRMVPRSWDKEVIKLNNSWYKSKPLPQWMSKAILKSTALRDSLWYASERNPERSGIVKFINPNFYPLVKIYKDNTLLWDAIITISGSV